MKALKYFFIFVILLDTTALSAQMGSYRRVLVKASPDSVQSWLQQELLPAHFSYVKGLLEMELDTTELSQFKARGIGYTDISERFYGQAQRVDGVQSAPANFTYGSMGGYYTYDEAMAVLDDMRTKFPNLISGKDTIGFTYEGKPIVAMRISDNPDVQELDEDEWLMTGLHHANEVMGMHIVIYFAWYLLENYDTDKEIRTLLNNSALYIVPVVNPDGLLYNQSTNPTGGGAWRKNRKPRVISGTTHYGIDLNRNYGMKWAYTHPGILGQAGSSFAGNNYYRGTAAWSEAETQAIRSFVYKHEFTSAFNYHAWDDSFNYPWNFDIDSLTDDSVKYEAITQYLIENNHFKSGTFDKTLQYTAGGTSDDWLYGDSITKKKIFAFTIEVGKSFWHPQSFIAKYCDSLQQANIKMLRMAAKYAAIQETSSNTIPSLSHYIAYDLKRYSIKDTNFTVSITPLEPVVTGTDPAKLYPSLGFLGTISDTLHFTLSPGIINGTVLRFLLKVDNGMWSTVDTIYKTYQAGPTLPLGCTDYTEPNNVAANAKPLQPGENIIASITDSRDEDWFYIENTAGKTNIRVVLSDLPADFDMELFDGAGQKIALANRPYKFNDTLVFNTSNIGIFKLRIYGYNNAYHRYHCYNLNAELSNNPYELTGYTSYKDKSNEALTFSVYPLPARQQVSVSVKSRQAQAITWILTDNAGRRIHSGQQRINSGLSVFPLTVSHLSRGVYLLQIIPEASSKILAAKIVKE